MAGILITDQQNRTIELASNQLEKIAIRLNGQDLCVMTPTIREFRGWSPLTLMSHSPNSF